MQDSENTVEESKSKESGQTINISLTYHELSNLLNLIEVGLIQKGLDSVEDDMKKLYYSLIDVWGENAEVRTE